MIDYLEQYTILYKVDRYIDDQNSSFVECGGGGRRRHRLNTIEHQWQIQYHYKRCPNIVISDMDTTNTCDHPFVKLLRIYCCEWNFQSLLFRKFQVSFSIKLIERLTFSFDSKELSYQI